MEEEDGKYQICRPTKFNFYGLEDQIPSVTYVYQPVLEKCLKNWQKNAIVFFKVSMKPFSICLGVYRWKYPFLICGSKDIFPKSKFYF